MIAPLAMLYTPALNKYLVVLVPAALLLYGTSHPVNRLRTDMPASFVDVPASVTQARRDTAAKVAQAYWNVAVNTIQWQYEFGSSLPADPPDNFQIDLKLFGARPDSRSRYWARLRQVWSSPESWRTRLEWSSSRLTRPASQAEQWISDYLRDIKGS